MSQPESNHSESSENAAPKSAAPGRLLGVALFWARTVLGPIVAPLFILGGWGYADPKLPGPLELFGPAIFAWLFALFAGIGALHWLAGASAGLRARSAETKDLAGPYTGGRMLMLGVQLLYLVLLLPVGPGGPLYWAVAVATAFALMLLLRASADWNPATAVIVLLALATTLWPETIFSNAPAGPARACVPAGLNLYGGCLLAELAPAVIILHVLLLLLLHFRRHAPAAAVVVALGAVMSLLGVSEAQLEGLLMLTAVVFFFPGQAYRSALQQALRGLLWGAGLLAFALLAGPAGFAEAAGGQVNLLYPAWLAGLLFSDIGTVGLRKAGLSV